MINHWFPWLSARLAGDLGETVPAYYGTPLSLGWLLYPTLAMLGGAQVQTESLSSKKTEELLQTCPAPSSSISQTSPLLLALVLQACFLLKHRHCCGWPLVTPPVLATEPPTLFFSPLCHCHSTPRCSLSAPISPRPHLHHTVLHSRQLTLSRSLVSD